MAPHEVHGTHVNIIMNYIKIAFRKSAKNMETKISKHCAIFNIVKDGKTKKFIIVVGEYKVSQREFDTIEQAENYIGTKPYELIFNTTLTLYNYENKRQKNESVIAKTEEDNANNKTNQTNNSKKRKKLHEDENKN